MDKENLSLLLEELKNIQPLTLEKIPDIDLYMDQVTKFMEEKLSSFKRNNSQKVLTKTMINNYTKDKIVLPPDKKKYSKNHLVSLILIYHLKSVLSINDISYILKYIEDSKFDVYSYFVNLQENESIKLENDVKNLIDNIDNENSNEDLDMIYLVLSLLYDISLKKLLVEKIIDNFFK